VSFNPYEPPASAYPDAPGTEGAVSNRIIEALRKAKPWVSLVAISGLVVGILSVLIGLLVLFTAPEKRWADAAGIFYLVWGGITLGAAIPLHRFARGIRRLLHGGGMADLESALEAQARFWQLTGVITLISLFVMVVGSMLAIFAARVLTSLF
jgi:hypothetical protein